MSDAKELVSNATDYIEELIADMLEGDHQDNEVSLGRLLYGKGEIQVQLKVTRNRCDFLDNDEDELSDENEDVRRCRFCSFELNGGEEYHDACDSCAESELI